MSPTYMGIHCRLAAFYDYSLEFGSDQNKVEVNAWGCPRHAYSKILIILKETTFNYLISSTTRQWAT
jgi:hypothetical protein